MKQFNTTLVLVLRFWKRAAYKRSVWLVNLHSSTPESKFSTARYCFNLSLSCSDIVFSSHAIRLLEFNTVGLRSEDLVGILGFTRGKNSGSVDGMIKTTLTTTKGLETVKWEKW